MLPQQTDTHLRAKSGKGNFNWRIKFPLELPMKQWPRLRFQIWDKDFFSANVSSCRFSFVAKLESRAQDSIGEKVISLKGLCKKALKRKDRVKIYMKGKDRFWLTDFQHPNHPGKNRVRDCVFCARGDC